MNGTGSDKLALNRDIREVLAQIRKPLGRTIVQHFLVISVLVSNILHAVHDRV